MLVRKIGIKGLAVAAVATLSASAAGVVGAATAGAAPDYGDGCTQYMAYLVPGTGETSEDADPSEPVGMLAGVARDLEEEFGDDITVVTVPYSASAFDKGLTYRGSAMTGVKALSDYMSQCQNSDMVVAGYSQGAEVAGDVLWHVGNDNAPVPAERVKGAVLLADPKRGSEKLVGTKSTGQGIQGERPGGYGGLEGRIKWVCDPEDLYCNTTSDNPFLKVIGKAVTGNVSDNPVIGLDEVEDMTSGDLSELTSTFGASKLTDVPDKAAELMNRSQALLERDESPTAAQLQTISDLAQDLNGTFASSEDILEFAQSGGALDLLAAEKKGTPGRQTFDVLETMEGMDLQALVAETSTVVDTVAALTSGTASDGELVAGGEALQLLATTGMEIASTSEALSEVDRSGLLAATGVMGQLKISTVINTSLSGMDTVMAMDFPAIAENLNLLGQQLAALDPHGSHETSAELLEQLEPWVNYIDAANTDVMPMAARMVQMVPDPTGQALAGAQVMKVAGQVDIKRLYDNLKLANDVSWTALQGNPEAAAGLLPIAMDVSAVGLEAISTGLLGGTANKTGQSQADVDGVVGTEGAQDLVDLTSDLAGQMGEGDWSDMAQLVGDGLEYQSFISSGAHTTAYTDKPLVKGLSAVEYMAQYFIVSLQGEADADSDSDADAKATKDSDAKSDDDKDTAKKASAKEKDADRPTTGRSGGNGGAPAVERDAGERKAPAERETKATPTPTKAADPTDVDRGRMGPIKEVKQTPGAKPTQVGVGN